MIDEKIFKKVSIFVALGVLMVLAAIIIWPIATAIITGLILAYVFYPLYLKIFSSVKEKNLSALIVIFFVIFLIFVPLWFLFPLIIKQIFDIYLYLQKVNFFDFVRNLFPSLAQTEFSRDLATYINTFISNVVSKALSGASSVFLNLPDLALKAVVIFFVLFFGMRDAELFTNYVSSLSPFSKSTEKDLSKKFRDITNSVIRGYVLVGILQGILTGVGLLVFGVPQVLLLTLLAILVSIIPVLGAWVVWVPSAVYLLVSGHIFSGVCLAIYGAVFVSWVDNIIRPYIVSRKTKISSAIVLVGMIGGLIVFGILGLIIGPLILAYLLLILDAYRKNKFPSLFSS